MDPANLYLQGGAVAVLAVGAYLVLRNFLTRDKTASDSQNQMADQLIRVVGALEATQTRQTDAVLSVMSTLQESVKVQGETVSDLRGQITDLDAAHRNCERKHDELQRDHRALKQQDEARAERLQTVETRLGAMLRQRRRERAEAEE